MKYQIGEQIDPGMMAMMQGQGPEIQAQPQGGVPMDYSPQNVGQSYAQQFEAIQAKYEAQIDEIEKKIEKLNNRLSENPSDRTVQNQIKRLEAKKEKLEQQMDAEVQYLMDQVEQTGAMAENDPMSAMHNKEGNLEGYANSEEEMPMMQYGGNLKDRLRQHYQLGQNYGISLPEATLPPLQNIDIPSTNRRKLLTTQQLVDMFPKKDFHFMQEPGASQNVDAAYIEPTYITADQNNWKNSFLNGTNPDLRIERMFSGDPLQNSDWRNTQIQAPLQQFVSDPLQNPIYINQQIFEEEPSAITAQPKPSAKSPSSSSKPTAKKVTTESAPIPQNTTDPKTTTSPWIPYRQLGISDWLPGYPRIPEVAGNTSPAYSFNITPDDKIDLSGIQRTDEDFESSEDDRRNRRRERLNRLVNQLDRPLSDYALLGEGIANIFDNRAYKANEEAGRLKYSDNPYTRELDRLIENRYDAESAIRRNAQMDEADIRRSINRRKSSNDARSMGQKFAYNTMFDMIGDENAEKIRRQRDADIAKSNQYYDSLYENVYDKYANTQLENEQLNRGIDVNRINQALRIGNERKATRRDNLNMIASILGDEKDLQYYKDDANSWVELQKSIMDKVRLGMSYDEAVLEAIKEEEQKRNGQTSKKKGR